MLREARVTVAKALGGAALQSEMADLESAFLERVASAVEAQLGTRLESELHDRLEKLTNPIVEAYLRSASTSFGAAGAYDPMDQQFDAYMKSTGLFAILSACDDAIGSAASAVPLQLVRNPGPTEVILDKHPLLDLLKNPNPEQGHAQFWYAMAQQWGRSGNVYISCVGKPELIPWANPEELWVLPSGRMKPVPDRVLLRKGKAENPISHYVYLPEGGSEVRFLPSQILHIKRPHPTDPIVGLSPMKELETTLNQLFHANSWNSAYFKNGAAPGLTFIREGAALPTEEQRERFEKKTDTQTVGAKRVGSNMYLYGGWKVERGGNSPQEAGFLALIEMLTAHILAVKGVPPFAIGIVENANFSNSVEQQGYFYGRAVQPFLRAMTDAMNSHLMVRVWGQSGAPLALRHNYTSIQALAPTKTADAERAVSNYRGGIATRDESRAEIGYDAVGQERGGEDFFAQGSVLDDIVNKVRENALATRSLFVGLRDLAHDQLASDKPRARATRWTAAMRRMRPFEAGTAKLMDVMFEQMLDEVLREIESRSTGRLAVGDGGIDARWARDLFKPRDYEETFGPRLGAIAEAALKAGAEDLAEEALGRFVPFDVTTEAIQAFIDRRVAKSIKTIAENRLGEIEAIVTEAVRDGRTVTELAAALREHFEDNSLVWSQRIARTEIHALYTEGGVQGLKEAGASTKQWLSARGGNRRPGHQDADTQEVPVDADFLVEAADGTVVTGPAPGQLSGGAAENANCTCTVTVGGF